MYKLLYSTIHSKRLYYKNQPLLFTCKLVFVTNKKIEQNTTEDGI